MVTRAPSRVGLVERSNAPILVRRFFEGGPPGPLGAAAAHIPEVMIDFMPFIGAVYAGGAVEERLREMVVLRVSAQEGCRYCTETHADKALRSGFTLLEVRSLVGINEAPSSWAVREAAVLQFADAMCSDPDAAVAILQPEFADHEVVELVMLASATVMLNRFATALELPTDAACRLRLGDRLKT